MAPREQARALSPAAPELVVDASVAIAALTSPAGFGPLDGQRLVAPPLLWSETRSVLHAQRWRGELHLGEASHARERLRSMPVERREPGELGDEAWAIADELGLAKTYDAEYLALARLLGCRLVTVDARLRRAAARLGFVVGPTEL